MLMRISKTLYFHVSKTKKVDAGQARSYAEYEAKELVVNRKEKRQYYTNLLFFYQQRIETNGPGKHS